MEVSGDGTGAGSRTLFADESATQECHNMRCAEQITKDRKIKLTATTCKPANKHQGPYIIGQKRNRWGASRWQGIGKA